MESDLPSPAIVYEFLLQQQHAFLDHHGNTLIYRPWGQMDHTQVNFIEEFCYWYYPIRLTFTILKIAQNFNNECA